MIMSKLEGTGLENEHIEHIHVAPPSLGLELLDVVKLAGVKVEETGERVKLRKACAGVD